MKPYYEDHAVTIYNAPCEEVLPHLSDVGLIVTSPPYNLGMGLDDLPNEFMHDRARPSWGPRKQRFSEGYVEHEDAMPWEDYRAWQREVLSLCWASLNDTGAIFYNHKPRVQKGRCVLPTAYVPEEVLLRQVIVWDRVEKGMAFVPQAYNTGYEMVLLLAKPEFRLKSRSASAVSDIWRIHPERNSNGHPCPFPLGLPATAIESAAFSGPVLDPFMGVGTTLRAAKDAGHKAVGIEMSERYCEAAVARLAQEVLDMEAA